MTVKFRDNESAGDKTGDGTSFQDKFFSLLEEMTGKKRRITVSHPALTEFCGDSQDALFLSHMIYWCDKGKRTDGYIFRSKKQWQIETGLRRRTLDRITKKYQKNGLLKVRVKLADGSPTLHYKLDREALIDNISTFVQMKPENKSTNVPMSNEAIVDEQTPDGIGTNVQMEKYKCTNGKVQKAFSRKVQNAFSITRDYSKTTTKKTTEPPSPLRGAPSPTGDLEAKTNDGDTPPPPEGENTAHLRERPQPQQDHGAFGRRGIRKKNLPDVSDHRTVPLGDGPCDRCALALCNECSDRPHKDDNACDGCMMSKGQRQNCEVRQPCPRNGDG